jgi:hypothetical protein
MISKLKQTIKDFTVMRCIDLDNIDVQQFSNRTLFNFCNKALKNYIKFRLSLMQNETVQNIELKILEASVKAGIKYAESKFGVDIPDQGEGRIQQMAVDIVRAINERRIDLFLYGLEYATRNLEKDNTSSESNT